MDDISHQLRNHLSRLGVEPAQAKDLHTGQETQMYQLLGVTPLLKTSEKLEIRYSWYFATVGGKQKLIDSDNPAQGIRLGFNDVCFPISGEQAIIFRTKIKMCLLFHLICRFKMKSLFLTKVSSSTT